MRVTTGIMEQDSSDVSLTFWYYPWPDVNSHPVPAKLPERLCPDHVEEIVMEDDGRRKGIKRTLYQDQLNDIKKNGLCCPVCRNLDLRWITRFEDLRPGLEKAVLECKQCHALILYGLRFATGEDGEVGEVVRVSYTKDRVKKLRDRR